MRKMILVAAALLLSCASSHAARDVLISESVNYFIEAMDAYRAGKAKDAVSLYRKSALIEGENSRWGKFCANNIGVIYLEAGKLEQAEKWFNKALDIDPDYNPAQMNLGLVYTLQGNRCKSTMYWLRVLGIDLDYVRPQEPLVEDGTGRVFYIDP